MQDSEIVYRFKTDGVQQTSAEMKFLQKQVANMLATTNAASPAAGKLVTALNAQASSTDKVANATNRASKAQSNYFVHIAKTTVQSALVNKAFLSLVDSIGKAVKQVDLIENFPASMAALGLSASDASASFAKLREYVQSVGGDLTAAAGAVQRFAGVTKSVSQSVALYAGLNNALIAGGASAEVQASALEQITQAFSRGRPEAIEWKSALVAMSPQIEQVARAMGYINANALGEALRAGEVSIGSFLTKLTELATGTGPIAQQAIARMQGIQFAANVLSNTLTNGLTAIYQAVGRQNIIAFFNFLTQVISVLASWAVVLINTFINLFNIVSKLFGGPQIARFTGETAQVAANLGDGAGAAGGIADGLDDAGASAKKLNKQLASFDKMNVLADKETGGGGGGAGAGAGAGGGGINAGDAAALDGIFDNMGSKLQEASIWAKIFAGILAGLVGLKFASKIIKQIDDIIKAFRKFGGWVARIFAPVINFLKPIFATIGTFFANIFKSIPGIISRALPAIGAALKDFWVRILPSIGPWLMTALAWVGRALGVIGKVLGAIPGIGWIIAIITTIISLAIWAITDWQGFSDFWVGLWTNVSNFFVGIWNWMVEIVTGFWTWITELFAGIVAIFAGPFQIAWQIISSLFILLVAIVAITLEAIFNILMAIGQWVWENVIQPVAKFFVDLWNGIVKGVTDAWNGMMAILKIVGDWIFTNVITPVVNFFVGLWNTVVKIFTDAWNWILNTILLPVVSWISINIINPIVNFFKGMWDNISRFVNDFVTSVKNFLSPIINWIKTNIIDKIANFFTGLWNGIVQGVNGIVNGIKSVMSTIAGAVKAPINGVIDLINGVIDGINRIKVPDWVPGLGGKSPNFPKIPKLARGGVITQSRLINAGENGDEAIVPLENNTEWIDKLAGKINTAGGGQPIQVVVQIGEEQIVTRVIDLINEKTQMSGRNTILV